MNQRRHELTDLEWPAIEPLLPDKPSEVFHGRSQGAERAWRGPNPAAGRARWQGSIKPMPGRGMSPALSSTASALRPVAQSGRMKCGANQRGRSLLERIR
jgi:hypothetical protein